MGGNVPKIPVLIISSSSKLKAKAWFSLSSRNLAGLGDFNGLESFVFILLIKEWKSVLSSTLSVWHSELLCEMLLLLFVTSKIPKLISSLPSKSKSSKNPGISVVIFWKIIHKIYLEISAWDAFESKWFNFLQKSPAQKIFWIFLWHFWKVLLNRIWRKRYQIKAENQVF